MQFYGVISNLIEQYRPKYIFHLALPLAKIDNLNVEEALLDSNFKHYSNMFKHKGL